MRQANSVPAARTKTNLQSAWLLRLILIFLLLGANGCAWLDNKQRHIIYRPTQGLPEDFAGLTAGGERYFINVSKTDDQRVEMWWLPNANKSAPTLLYFHGTFRTVFQNMHKIEALREAGFAVLAVEYRGWGMSTPITPSEQTILQDADAAWAELQRREPRSKLRVIYGHSMGSGVAVDLASRLPSKGDIGALILESAFTSFTDVASEAGLFTQFLSYLNNERFASIEKITRVQAPVLMIHGSADTTIPMRLGEKLFATANQPKQWLLIEGGGHSDLDQIAHAQYQATLQIFMKKYALTE
jgi:pimeloyl-ACP methyl ester carboxylesterase